MDELKNILEALIFISVEPLTLEKIKEVLNDVSEEEILQALLSLGTELESDARAIRLVQTGGGWIFMTKPAFDPPVRKLLQIERRKKLSPAAPGSPLGRGLPPARHPDRHHDHPRRRFDALPPHPPREQADEDLRP